MNDPEDDLAAELARLNPQATRDRLNRRVAQALACPVVPAAPRLMPAWWCRWAPLATAAALVLVASFTALFKSQDAPSVEGGGLTEIVPPGQMHPPGAPLAPALLEPEEATSRPHRANGGALVSDAAPAAGSGLDPDRGAVLDPSFRRINQAHYLLEAADDGVIFTSHTTPWRKVRWEFLSASEWRDERHKTTIQVLIPREQTVVIPVRVL